MLLGLFGVYDNRGISRLLLDNGADANIKSKEGKTARDYMNDAEKQKIRSALASIWFLLYILFLFLRYRGLYVLGIIVFLVVVVKHLTKPNRVGS